MIRYLIVWHVRTPLVRAPSCLPAAISTVLGTLIAERLPTQQARSWHKALGKAQGQAEAGRFAATNWPIEAVVFAPPGKHTYGQDEIIWWELKLLGPHADHGLFLEVFLPAIEAAANTRDPRWFANYSLWGRFAVQSILVAHGPQWEPLAEDGRLNLSLRPSAAQWAEGLWKAGQPASLPNRIRWVTPFDLGAMPGAAADGQPPARAGKSIAAADIPSLDGIIAAFLRRAAHVLHGKGATAQDPLDLLEPDERTLLQETLAKPQKLQGYTFVRPPKLWPGQRLGEQIFATPVPAPLLPYLNLAAILHVGDYTHYGCGTFRLK